MFSVRPRENQTRENKKDGEKESFSQKPNLWMLKRKPPKKECEKVCVCFSLAFPWLFTAQSDTGDCLKFTHTVPEEQNRDRKRYTLSETSKHRYKPLRI